jgi:hypothetical protein
MNQLIIILKSITVITTDVTVALATTITNQTPVLSKAVAAARAEFMKAAGEEKLMETFGHLTEAASKYEKAVEGLEAGIKKSLGMKTRKEKRAQQAEA